MRTAAITLPADTQDRIMRPRRDLPDHPVSEGTPHIVFTVQVEVLGDSEEEGAFLDSIGDSLSLAQIVGEPIGEAVLEALEKESA